MKKKNTSTLSFSIKFLILLSLFNVSQFYGQNWQWAVGATGSGGDYAKTSCIDASGNVIMTGQFSSNPLQMGTVTLNNAGGSDGVITKLSPTGTVIWSQKIGGTGNESITGVTTDAAGNIYVTGYFSTAFLSIPPVTIPNFTNNATYDVFVACFNSAGIIQWGKAFGGALNEYSGGCVFSNSLSCLYVTGSYNSTTFTAGTNTITNSNITGANTDLFLARLTNTGSVTWFKNAGSSTSDDRAYEVAIDASSDPYFCGLIAPTSGTTVIGVTTLTTLGGQDILLAKYNSAGTPQWAKNFGSTLNASADFVGGISIDPSNNILINGYHNGAALIAGTFTLANSGGYDAFAAKTNSLGVFQWATKIGASLDEYGYDITNDASGNAYVAGAFSGTTVAVGSVNLTNSNPGANTEIYVLKLNSAGVGVWGRTATGTSDETALGIVSDAAGFVYVSGNTFTSPTAFGSTTLTSSGSADLYISKIGCLNAGILMPSSLCAGSSATLSATGATSYTWNTGATGNLLVVSPTVTSTYSVMAAVGTCTGTSNVFTLSVIPAFVNVGSNLNLLCSQSQGIIGTTTPSNPTSVVWTPTTGLSSSTVLSPTVTSNGVSTQYTVTANLSNGCVANAVLVVSGYAPVPSICMVTVDSLSNNNEIYWDKTSYSKIDSFIIYRETSTNIFKRIAAVGKNALSMYTDTARSIGPANGNPNFTSYKYKLQLRDSCGAYSSLSPWHQTMFNQDQQNGNFNWNAYAIEGATTTPVSNYVLNRVNLATGITTSVAATTGFSISDPQYASLFASNIKWFVDAQGFNCNPTAKLSGIAALKTRTKSNQTNEKTFPVQGVKENYLNNLDATIYPNPSKDIINIDLLNVGQNLNYKLQITNTLGQEVYQTILNNQKSTINIQTLKSGIYFLNIKQNDHVFSVKKIIVE